MQVLVCEDPSSADCNHVLTEFKSQFDDFVVLRNDVRRGACHSRNRMLHAADGEFVTGLDDDDYFEPDRIERFLAHPRLEAASFLCTTTFAIDANRSRNPAGRRDRWIDLQDMKRGNQVGNQIFARTRDLRASGGFDERMPAWQDFELWFRFVKQFGPGFKIDNESYRINLSDSHQRITTSVAASSAFSLFVEKHGAELSPYEVACLRLRDRKNRGGSIGIRDFKQAMPGLSNSQRLDIAQRYLRYRLGTQFPLTKKAFMTVVGRLSNLSGTA